MSCQISEEQLFSWIDRRASELEEHLHVCPECRNLSQALLETVTEVSAALRFNPARVPERIGGYVIHRFLGEGGQGWVFEAAQDNPRRLVALKVVKGGRFGEESDRRRLRREAETLARLKHPGIASIYEAGETAEGQNYFAMEFIAGPPLIEYAREHGLSLRRRLELFCRVCEALQYAHGEGVVHRDLKPSNILVEKNDQPKLLDFGLAQLTTADPSLSTTMHEPGRILGTLRYMSPEHARGSPKDIDVRSDVYSLCVILYELATGRPPHELKDLAPHEALRVICEESPTRPGRYASDVSGDLETIILKGLEKDPERRYQSVGDLLFDVQSYLAGRPIRARPPSLTYKFRKLVARNKLTAALLSIIFVGAGAFGTWIGLRYAEARATIRGLDEPITFIELSMRFLDSAELARRDGQYDLAERFCRRALHELRRRLPEGSTAIMKTRVLLGRILTAAGRPDEAEPMLRVALVTHLQSHPEDRTALAEAQSALGECLLRRGAFREAEPYLLAALESLKPARGDAARRAAEVRRALSELYDAWGKPKEAAAYRDGLAGDSHGRTPSRQSPSPKAPPQAASMAPPT